MSSNHGSSKSIPILAYRPLVLYWVDLSLSSLNKHLGKKDNYEDYVLILCFHLLNSGLRVEKCGFLTIYSKTICLNWFLMKQSMEMIFWIVLLKKGRRIMTLLEMWMSNHRFLKMKETNWSRKFNDILLLLLLDIVYAISDCDCSVVWELPITWLIRFDI